MVKPKVNKHIKDLLKKNKQGIKLELGCGANKNDGFVGIDVLPLKGVDIVHDLEKFPWPLPDNSASFVMSAHLVEHINPARVDARLVGLVDLLLKKKLLTEAEVGEYLGDYNPGSLFLRFMDEVWRVLEPGGQFMFVLPYAGSHGFWWDPTHVNACTEMTWEYFDPLGPRTGGTFYNFYKPLPWKVGPCVWTVEGNMETVLIKREFRKDGKYVN